MSDRREAQSETTANPVPQPGIFAEGSRFHYVLEYRLASGVDERAVGKAIAGAVSALDYLDIDETNLVLAFGPDLWRRLTPKEARLKFDRFVTIGALDGLHAPATQCDVWAWVHGSRHDANFDAALAIHRALGPVARPELDLAGFDYRDSHDLTGFEDGTANPKGAARFENALIPSGEPGAGGAFVFSQRWIHDLDRFAALPVGEQEGVIGRTKSDSIELEGDAMPADSHVSRTDVAVDGVTQKIYRRSFPYGSVTEHGLYFLAFACDQSRFQVQLERMFGTSGDGLSDRLTEFSAPVSGSYWFAPAIADLQAVLVGLGGH